MNTYNTFENLGSGLRLFDFDVQMHSLDHNGFLFDNLTFSNFGYGGDPNNVSRMHVEKNKWYDFRLLFRRDKNFWDYNLFANPLNPAALNPPGSVTTGCYVGPPTAAFPQGAPAFCSNPAVAQNSSLNSLYLTRRMQDYDLTLLPTSKVRFRLGYSRNRNEGPGSYTTDGGTISAFADAYSYTTNAYRVGVDFKILPRTTLSFDEFLIYFKQDNIVIDNPAVNPRNFGFVLANPSGGRARRPAHQWTWETFGVRKHPPRRFPARLRSWPARPTLPPPLAMDTCLTARSAIREISCPRSGFASNRTISRISRCPDRWATAPATT